jgi:hypothetical protein
VTRAVVVLPLVAALSSCASAPAPGGALVVRDGDEVRYAGAAAWTVRATSSGREDVVAVPGVGELIVGERGCRLVRALPDGALAVQVGPSSCAEVRGDRLCFAGARFVDEGGGASSVNGCADRNEVLLERLEAGGGATIGPTSFVERCAPVPSTSPTWLHVRAIFVDDNDQPEHGLRLRYRDGFEVCFLARSTGRYRVEVDVEDPARRRISLSGDVGDL